MPRPFSQLQFSLPLLVAAFALAASPSQALIVKTWNGVNTPALINTSPPADNPGFSNLSLAAPNLDNKRGVYLGDGLFLTVVHDDISLPYVKIGNGVFPVIPGSTVDLVNPSSFGSSSVANGKLTPLSDLRLYRLGIDATTGLSPEDMDPAIRRISLATRLPNTATEQLTMIGKGYVRTLNAANTTNGQTYYNAAGGVITNPASWPTATYRGFEYGDPPTLPRPWQWGTNYRSTATPSGMIKVGENVLIEVPNLRDTVGFVVRFDESGLPDEAQGARGDSGGPVFWKDGDEWVLAGLMHAVFPANNNNNLIGAFGSFTAISDLSYSTYSTQIANARTTFSKMGDLNLDGVVTGSIVNGVPTGDLAVMVNNWLYTSTEANVHTWMKGDLNLDGRVDLADFVLMRNALGGTISSTAFAQLVAGALSIPEPSTLALAVAAGLASTRRRRR